MSLNSTRTAHSGTPEYPTPCVLVERMVNELVSTEKWNWVTFETEPMKHFVEVAHDGGDDLEINVAYGFSEDYKDLFARHGLSIPDDWLVKEFKKKGWLGSGTMLLAATVREIDRVALFIDVCFKTIYGKSEGYQLSGVFRS